LGQKRSDGSDGLVHQLAQHQPVARLGRPGSHAGNGSFQAGHALAAMTDGLYHREAEQLLHQREVDLLAGGARLVRHVETQHRTAAGLHDLREQDQIALQLCGIRHHRHHVGLCDQLLLRHTLVGRQ
jgi:hypothetical protein